MRTMLRLLVLLGLSFTAANGATFDLIPGENLFLFTEGKPIRFTISRTPQTDQAGEFAWVLRDADHKTKGQGTAVLPLAGQENAITLPALPFGYYQVTVTGPDKAELIRSFVVCPPIRPKGNPHFGVSVGHLTLLGPDLPAKIIAGAGRLGFSWVRHPFSWWDVNPQPGVWNWHMADQYVNESRKAGLDIVGSLFYPPPWASTAPPSVTDRRETYMPRPEPFLEYCETVAKRYAGQITWWETWNEPDYDLFWRGNGKSTTHQAILTDLVELSRLAQLGVKRGNPNARLLAFGATGVCPEGLTYKPFLATVLDQGCGKYFDALAVHYGADLKACRSLLAAAKAPTEIWITEAGGGDAPLRGGPDGHIHVDIVQAVSQWAAGAERIAKYTFWPVGFDADMALFNPDGTPKPVAAAWALFNDLTRSATCRGELNVVRSVDQGYARAVGFDTPEGPLTVLWLEFAKQAVCTLPMQGDDLRISDPLGRKIPTERTQEGVRFHLGVLPVYIRGTIIPAGTPPVFPRIVSNIQNIRVEPLKYAGFEGPERNLRATWQPSSDMNQPTEQVEYAFVRDPDRNANTCLQIKAAKPTQWPCLQQILPLRRMNRPLFEHEEIVYRLEGSVRTRNVIGRGAFIEISYLKADGTRIWPPTFVTYLSQTQSWQVQNTGWFPAPPETALVAVRCYLGQAQGEAWFDNLKLHSAVRRQKLVFDPATQAEDAVQDK